MPPASSSDDDDAQQQPPPAVLETDTLILGAGPQALCVASALLEPQPYALDDYAALGARRRVQGAGAACRPEDLLVVDPAGAWLAGWRTAFAHLEIPVLRSHMLAHPDPWIELALVEAEMACRSEQQQGGEEAETRRTKKTKGRGGKGKATGAARPELFGGLVDSSQQEALLAGTAGIDVLAWNKRLMKGGGEDHASKKKGKGKSKGRSPASSIRPFLQDHDFLFARPSSQAFLRLCDGLVARYGLADRVLPGKAVAMTRTGPNQVLVGLSDGRAIRARRVVSCLGPTGQLRIPRWAAPFRPLLQSGSGVEGVVLHSFELPRLGVSHTELYQGRHVLVVGGGLTAAHLVLSAHRHGAASVTLLARRPIRLQEFCFGVEWAGREQHRLLAQYRALPVAERLQTLKDSRPGGTITPSIMAQLRALTAQSGGRVRVIEGAEVEALRPVVLGCAAGAAAACSCSAGGQAAQARRPLAAASAAGEMKVGNGWHVRVRMRDEQEPPLELVADRIVLGTGVEVDVRKDPLLAPFLDEMAVTGGTGKAGDAHCFAGLPVPELSLRLPLSGMEVYVMGPYAALAIGPNAGNLAGGMAASRIIADEIRASKRRGSGGFGGGDQAEEDEDDDGGGWGDVQDIHDLNNPFELLGGEEDN